MRQNGQYSLDCHLSRTIPEGETMTVAFDEVVEKVTDAGRQVEADGGASPVLVAVVREFQAKLAKATKHATGGLPDHDFVVELEQAGDSAKVAAEADALPDRWYTRRARATRAIWSPKPLATCAASSAANSRLRSSPL